MGSIGENYNKATNDPNKLRGLSMIARTFGNPGLGRQLWNSSERIRDREYGLDREGRWLQNRKALADQANQDMALRQQARQNYGIDTSTARAGSYIGKDPRLQALSKMVKENRQSQKMRQANLDDLNMLKTFIGMDANEERAKAYRDNMDSLIQSRQPTELENELGRARLKNLISQQKEREADTGLKSTKNQFYQNQMKIQKGLGMAYGVLNNPKATEEDKRAAQAIIDKYRYYIDPSAMGISK